MNTEPKPGEVEIRDIARRQEAPNSPLVGTMINNMSLDARRWQETHSVELTSYNQRLMTTESVVYWRSRIQANGFVWERWFVTA
jgi:hypothetical protein